MTMMVEQKSGKAAYNPSDPATPRIRPEHYVQALLYMAIFRYNYGVAYSNFIRICYTLNTPTAFWILLQLQDCSLML